MRKPRWFAVVTLLGALSLVAAACAEEEGGGGGGGGGGGVDCATVEFGCVEVGPDDPINIGVAQVISGADATLGQDQVNGINLALDYRDGTFDETNGTVLDHAVELTVEDDGCTAEGGQAAATALAADTSVVAVIGTSCSSGSLGVADTIFSEKGIIQMSASNTNPALTAEGTHQPFYTRTAHNDRIQGAIVAEFTLGKLGAKTAATIADESPYTQGLVAAFEQNFEAGGGTITGSEQVNSEDTDFKAPLRSLAEGNPDVLYFPIFVAACTLIIKQANEIMPDAERVVSDGCSSSDTLKNAAADIDGVYASGPDLAGIAEDPFYKDELLPAYKEQFGTAPTSVYHTHAFDATNIILDAIEAVAIQNDDGSLSIPRQALRDEVFATNGYDGVTGTFTCTPLGDCATDVTIAIYRAPGWPVEGGTDKPPVYSDTKSLDEVL
jgi:branched-chain amino acid transport system substrate-binding protein